jgi:hypothetical protein
MGHSHIYTFVACDNAIYATVLSPKTARADEDRGVLHSGTSTKTADEAYA